MQVRAISTIIGIAALTSVLGALAVLALPRPIVSSQRSSVRVSPGGIAQRQDGLAVAYPEPGNVVRIPLLRPNDTMPYAVIGMSVVFPKPAKDIVQVRLVSAEGTQNMYAEWQSDSQLVVGSSQSMYGEGYPTLIITAPAGYFNYSPGDRIRQGIGGITFTQGSVLGLALIVLAWLVLKLMLRSHWGSKRTLMEPPQGVTPIQYAILHHSTIRPDDFIAFLYDLTSRGCFEIIVHETTTVMVRKENYPPLRPDEQGLLDLLFPNSGTLEHLETVVERLGAELFSAAVSQLYIDAYTAFDQRLYFSENPRRTHLRVKALAIAIQFTGVVAAIVAGFTSSDYPGLAPIAAGLYAVGVISFRAARSMSRVTQTGSEILEQCAAFSRWLTLPSPIRDSTEQGRQLFRYLGYAMALGVVPQWIARFRESAVYLPDWLSFDENSAASPEQFTHHFLALSRSVAEAIVLAKDPNAD